LTPLGKLSGAFLAPKNGEMLQFAYYESSLVVEFIVQKFGLEALKLILADLRDGRGINDSIAARTAPLAEMEKQFDAFAQARAKELAPGVDLEKPPTARGEIGNGSWEESHPKNYYLRLRKAHEAMTAKVWTDARPLLESLASDYHGESRAGCPLWLLAVTERNLKDTNAELAALQKFAAQEADFEDLYIRLIEISRDRKDWKAASDYAEKLLAINPLIAAPHRALADAGIALGRNEQAITACRKLLLLDPPDPAQVHFDLARLLHARGDAEIEAKRHALQALEDAPRFRDAQRLLLEIEGTAAKPAGEAAPKRDS
jgi:tetratricopeptide (TPR) repeat protein